MQRVRRGRAVAEENRRREENVFEIGDEDEDDEGGDVAEQGDARADRSPPPGYDDRDGRSGGGEGVANGMGHDQSHGQHQDAASRSGSTRGSVRSQSTSRRSARSGVEGQTGQDAELAEGEVEDATEEDLLEVVEVRHPVSRSDTLLAIARKYAADVSRLVPSTRHVEP